MICDICKKNEANIHVTKVINGVKQEFNICEKCAKEKEGLNVGVSNNFPSALTFQNILSGIMDYMNQSSSIDEKSGPICENCGMTYSEFKKIGLVGCNECYKKFSNTLMPVVKRVQGNIEHTGKVPNKISKELIEKKKILKLKEELQKAITLEEYERAAEIRDEIKKIQSDSKEGGI